MHHPGRPSSSTAQHVINMAGMDPGLGFAGSVGGSGSSNSSSGHTAVQQSSAASTNAALAANAAMMSSIPPGAYRNTPSQQHRNHMYQAQAAGPQQQQHMQSPRTSGTLSPQTIGSVHSMQPGSGFISPRSSQFPGGLSPPLSAGSGGSSSNQQQLARSQSLGHAAYQQYHQHQHMQGQQPVSNVPQMPLSPTAADMYTAAVQRRDRQQQYSDGSAGGAPSYGGAPVNKGHAAGSLLPTINTHIPSASLSANSPYTSPSTRQSFQLASTSPVASSAYGSPYGSSQQTHQNQYAASSSSSHNRPMSMMDPGYASSSTFSGAPTMSPSSNSNKRASMSHMTGLDSTILPLHHSPQINTAYQDSLPLYSTGALNRPPSSPYMPVSPIAPTIRLGAPPRGSIGSAHSPAALSSEQDLQQRLQANSKATMSSDGTIRQNRERRGTISNQDAISTRTNDFEVWDRRQRAQKRRVDGFRRVRDMSDLKVILEPAQQGKGRRADPTGGYVSPLKAMTAYLHHTYHLVNPAFFYELSFNPRRVLTKPSRPMHNDGHDNEDSDYILYVNDWLGSEESNRYLILDILGQGTFGQVVKCQNMKTREIVAVKVIKNKPAYFNQSMMEVTILEMLNGNWDPNDEHHILRLRDTFIHAKHLCLVFELLSSNLYELIKQNSFRGLSTSLVRVFTTQLLDALTILHEARLIHCDLKPENILLKTLQTPSIKLVDFGSACHERQVVYTYIQSRFYRSPEVLLGLPYNAAIDMWSLGCIAIELFLGLPLFPGTSEYNQICRIVEMLGLPPQWMLEQGKQTGEFFNVYSDEYGRRQYKLKSLDQYSKEHNVQEQPSKRYFQATTLPDIVKTYPMSRKSGKPADVQKEMTNRTSFIDFVSGLLNMDPNQRWTPEQAKLHPFITTEKFTQPFRPPVPAATAIQRSSARPSLTSSNSGSSTDRHPFGGLPESTSNRQGSRTYQDAAAYNQHLIQQQAYNQAHQARQNQINNPYARAGSAAANAQAQAAATQAQMAHAQVHAQAQAQAAQIHAAAISPPNAQIAGQQQQYDGGPQQSSATFTGNRSRSDTLTRMDVIPPQLARMGLDPPANSMTPVSKRDENVREWERQQQGVAGSSGGANRGSDGKAVARDHQHLNLLHQQTEQSQQGQGHAQWPSHGSSTGSQQGYPHSSGTGNAIPFSVVVDGSGRQQVARNDNGVPTQIMAPPPAAYAAKQSANAAAGLGFDPYQPDNGQSLSTLQPSQYHTIGHTAATSPSLNTQMRLAGGMGAMSNRHSIAVPNMTQGGHQNSSLAALQGLYGGPVENANMNQSMTSTGYVQQPPQPAVVATNANVNANNVRNDGFGGLSDLMFGSNQSTIPGNNPSAATHRYSMLPNGSLTSSAHAVQPPHSPLEGTTGFATYHTNPAAPSHR